MLIENTGLRSLCPTHWTVRTGAITAVLKNYSSLLQALRTIAETSYDDYGRRASGHLTLLEKFDTYFGMKLFHLKFSSTEQASMFKARTHWCKKPSVVLKSQGAFSRD